MVEDSMTLMDVLKQFHATGKSYAGVLLSKSLPAPTTADKDDKSFLPSTHSFFSICDIVSFDLFFFFYFFIF
jgi:hypothetical protein